MLVLTREQARLFRSVVRSTLLEQEPAGEWPLVHYQTNTRGGWLQAQKAGMA